MSPTNASTTTHSARAPPIISRNAGGDTVGFGAARFLGYGAAGSGLTDSQTAEIVPRGGVIQSVFVDMDTNTLDGPATLEVLVDGAPQAALDVTIPTGVATLQSNTTGRVTVSAGSTVSLRITAAGTSGNIAGAKACVELA